MLEESIDSLSIPVYQELKLNKISECKLLSYHFFKSFSKKEIGKENNYIFNFKDNYLNDMSKIDKEFFEDFYKFDKKSEKIKFDFHKFFNCDNKYREYFEKNKDEIKMDVENFIKLENLPKEIEMEDKVSKIYQSRDLVYEFSIYHPLKNNKTQEILIIGSSYLHQLKDKIYCVLDEIQNSENNNASFFFIENCFFNDLRDPSNKILSSKILENKIRKLNCYNYSNDYTKNNNNSNTSKLNSNNNFTNYKNLYNSNNSNLISSLNSNNEISNCESSRNQLNQEYNNQNEYNRDDLKFPYYNKDLYSLPMYISSEIYDEISMSDKKLNEINFRIGYPYLFRHLDHCDHMIMLTDIRYLDEYDRFDDENKCFVTFQKKLKRRICDSCSFYYAKFISINDKITNDYKVLFYCESCLKKIHNNEFKDSNLPTNLKLIPYFHD